MTYLSLLQLIALLFAAAAALLMCMAISVGNWRIVPLQALIIVANIGLFIWQGTLT